MEEIERNFVVLSCAFRTSPFNNQGQERRAGTTQHQHFFDLVHPRVHDGIGWKAGVDRLVTRSCSDARLGPAW